jgi:hypothetical protein
MQHPKKPPEGLPLERRHPPVRRITAARVSWVRRSRALGTSTGPPAPVASLDVASADWRTLVLWAPDIAVERLARDIGSGRFHNGGLRARAQDLRAHLRPEIRERARTEFFTALEMGDDGLGPGRDSIDAERSAASIRRRDPRVAGGGSGSALRAARRPNDATRA